MAKNSEVVQADLTIKLGSSQKSIYPLGLVSSFYLYVALVKELLRKGIKNYGIEAVSKMSRNV